MADRYRLVAVTRLLLVIGFFIATLMAAMVVRGATVGRRHAAAPVVLCSVVPITLIVLLIAFIGLLGPVRIIGMLARALSSTSSATCVLLILMLLAAL